MSVKQCCFIHGDFTGDGCPECKPLPKSATSAESKLARVAAFCAKRRADAADVDWPGDVTLYMAVEDIERILEDR
jgi:hypothetical protein